MAWGLGVRVPHCSLFHDEKFAFFDFGVRGSPKILKILLGVWLKILKFLGFDRRREAAAGQLFPKRRVQIGASFRPKMGAINNVIPMVRISIGSNSQK